jgi:hypothetical protein
VRITTRAPVFALAGWTLFVWATRIRNAMADDDLSNGSKAVAVTVATLFTLGGIAVLAAAITRRHVAVAVRALAAFTIVYWPVRVVQIVAADHGVGFTLVHTVLGAVSVGLAAWAWSSLAGARAPRRAGILPGR